MDRLMELDDLRRAYTDAFLSFEAALTAAEADGSSSNLQRLDDAAVRLRAAHRKYFACKRRLRRIERWLKDGGAHRAGHAQRSSTARS
jgi:hypothetical protein